MMNRFMSSVRPSLATGVACALIFTSSVTPASRAYAAPVFPALSGIPTPPENLGFLAEHHQGTNGRQVILIQDLHAHLDTQKKIIGLLNFYDKNGYLQHPVGLEGATGVWDLSIWKDIPLKERKQAFYDYLLEEAGLTGPEWFALNTNRPTLLMGIDSPADVVAQRALYVQSRGAREIAAQQLSAVIDALNVMSDRELTSHPLGKWRHLTQDFDSGKLQADLYLRHLNDLAGKVHLSAQTATLRTALMARSAADMAQLSVSDRFYSDLRKYGQQVGIALAKPAQQNLIKALYAADLLKRMMRQQLTLQDIQQVGSRPQEMAELVHQLIESSGESSWFDSKGLLELVRICTDFYVAALVRDEPMAQNTLGLFALPKLTPAASAHAPETVILVAGGFHTTGLTEAFRKAGVSYDVITPNITAKYTVDDEERYADRMAGQPVSLKRFLSNRAASSNDVNAEIRTSQSKSANDLLSEKIDSKKDDPDVISLFGNHSAWLSLYKQNLDQRSSDSVGGGYEARHSYHGVFTGLGLNHVSLENQSVLASSFLSAWGSFKSIPLPVAYSRMEEVHVFSGQLDPEELAQIDMTLDGVSTGDLFARGRKNGSDDHYEGFIHEDALKSAEDFLPGGRFATPESERLIAAVIAFHESVEGHTDTAVRLDGQPVTHHDLEMYGATLDSVLHSLRIGDRTPFIERVTHDLSLNLDLAREKVKMVPQEPPPVRSTQLTAERFTDDLVPEMMQRLAEGRLPYEVLIVYNNKEMVSGMHDAVIFEDNRRLMKKYRGHLTFKGVIELPTERLGDFPALMGLDEKIIGELRRKAASEGKKLFILCIPDGGFKTRFMDLGLQDGFASQTALAGDRFANVREAVLIATLVLAQYIPDADQYVWLNGNDNVFAFGQASIGGVPLDRSTNGLAHLREMLKKTTLINGGSRISLLDQLDSEERSALAAIPKGTTWTAQDLETRLGQPKWEQLLDFIERGKLYELGLFTATRSGDMTGFGEKITDRAKLVQFLYEVEDRGEWAYANPVQQILHAGFLAHIRGKAQAVSLQSPDLKPLTLDHIPASYMQFIFEAHFALKKAGDYEKGLQAWLAARDAKGKIGVADWTEIYKISNEVWDEEAANGRGDIKILDFGSGHYWLDLAHLPAFKQFSYTIGLDAQQRRRFGVVDPSQPRIHETNGGKIEIVGNGPRYVDLVSANNVHVIIESGHDEATPSTTVENVVFIGRPGHQDIIRIPQGAILRHSRIDLNVLHSFEMESGAVGHGLFSESGVGDLIVHEDEIATVLRQTTNGNPALPVVSRNIISMPPNLTFGAFVKNQAGFAALQQKHPELLGGLAFDQVQNVTPLQLTRTLPGMNFKDAQRHLNYAEQVVAMSELHEELNAAFGFHERPVNTIPMLSRRWVAVALGIVGLIATVFFPIAAATQTVSLTTAILGAAYALPQAQKFFGSGNAAYEGGERGTVTGATAAYQRVHEFIHSVFAVAFGPSQSPVREVFEEVATEVLSPLFGWLLGLSMFIGRLIGVATSFRAKPLISDRMEYRVQKLSEFIASGTADIADISVGRNHPQSVLSSNVFSHIWGYLVATGARQNKAAYEEMQRRVEASA